MLRLKNVLMVLSKVDYTFDKYKDIKKSAMTINIRRGINNEWNHK